MVPLEARTTYLQSVAENRLLNAFDEFLHMANISKPSPTDLNEIDGIYYNSMSAIINNDNADFDVEYKLISKRLPSNNSLSPFVHNDFLIFTLVCGIIKFKYDRSWISQVLAVRAKNIITTTFDNLVREDFESKSNNHSIVVGCLKLIDGNLSDKLMDDAYNQIVSNRSLFEDKSDIIKLCSLRAYDLVVLSRKMIDETIIIQLKNFEVRFLKRVKTLSKIIYNAIIVMVVFGIYQILVIYPNLTATANYIALIIGVLGVSLGNLFDSLCNQLEMGLRKIFGYKTN